MKKIIYCIISIFILLGCVSCTNNNVDLDDAYYNKLPLYEEKIRQIISLEMVNNGGKPVVKYEFLYLNKNNEDDVKYIKTEKLEGLFGKYWQKAIVFTDKIAKTEIIIAIQFDNAIIAEHMRDKELKRGVSQYRYKNILMADFCYSYFIMDDYEEVNNLYINKYYKALLGGNNAKNVVMTGEIREIVASAFFNDESIEKLTTNNELIRISSQAFYGVKNLKSVTLNQGLVSIQDYAFYKTSIEYIVIPDSVKYMGKNVFNCGKIYLDVYSRPSGWRYDFAVEKADVYYKGQWEYNEEGIPVPLV